MDVGRNASAGHIVLEPLHVSSRSHGPADGRQTVPDAAAPAPTHAGVPLEHEIIPRSHGLPVPHGAPGVQPEVHMPTFDMLPDDDLRALATYLEGLR